MSTVNKKLAQSIEQDEMKNHLETIRDGVNNRLDTTEERNSDLEDRFVKKKFILKQESKKGWEVEMIIRDI